MAANSGCFESASNIEERKSLRRQARKEEVEKVITVRFVEPFVLSKVIALLASNELT